MLKSFQIRNFRLFRHLEVGRLGRVNLVVGENNAGKSTFLEAVELYASNASPTVLLDLVEFRQETWFSEAQPHLKSFFGNPIRHLFFGHRLPRIGEEGISIGDVSSSAKLHIGVAAYQSKYDDEGTTRRIRISDELDENLSNVEVFLVVEEDEKTRMLFRLDRDIRDIRRKSRVFYDRQDSEFKYTWQVVSTDNMSNRKVAALWDLTSLTNLESEVISALALIDDRVSGVAFVEDVSNGRGGDNRIPLVKMEGIEEPAWQDEPGRPLGQAITKQALRPHTDIAVRFTDWLTRLFT